MAARYVHMQAAVQEADVDRKVEGDVNEAASLVVG